ncbi:hypothetical protein HY745_00980 [Candidatus Desantisbacteria bacterium]|nr:hypothetical protein [Candidatus Desantisbacteria bacterium]
MGGVTAIFAILGYIIILLTLKLEIIVGFERWRISDDIAKYIKNFILFSISIPTGNLMPFIY